MLAMLLIATLAEAACPHPSTAAEVEAAVSDSLEGFSGGYEGRFREGLDAALSALPCLREPLSTEQAAAVHRLEALHSFVEADPKGATQAFRAALRVEPNHVLPAAIAPSGGPIDQLYQQARAAEPAATAPIADQGYELVVDGRTEPIRPLGLPAIVQYLAPNGDLAWTGRIYDGTGLPTLPPTIPPEPEPEPELPVSEPQLASTRSLDSGSLQPNAPMLVAAGGTAAVGAGLLVAGLLTRGSYNSSVQACLSAGCDRSVDDLEAQRARANTLGSAGQGTLAAAAGLGVLSIAIPW